MENHVVVSQAEYRDLPVVQLQESPTNPRRRFDARSLEELAASFRTQGVIQPLVVRPKPDDLFEVVAGARRLRAIATRYDKTAQNFLAAVYIVATAIWLVDDTP